MNIDLWKNDFEKDCFRLINNVVLGKTTKHVKISRDVKAHKNGKKKETFSVRTKLLYEKI